MLRKQVSPPYPKETLDLDKMPQIEIVFRIVYDGMTLGVRNPNLAKLR